METLELNENCCVICRNEFQNTSDAVQVTRGIPNLIKFSQCHGDDLLTDYLNEQHCQVPPGKVYVHSECRRVYVDTKRLKRNTIDTQPATPKKQKLRCSVTSFDWKINCVFCCKVVIFDSHHPDRYNDSRAARYIPLRQQILRRCEERGDHWAYSVEARLNGCIDLVAAEAVYHNNCHTRFYMNKDLAASGSNSKPKGRPEDKTMSDIFQTLCSWFDDQTELFTLDELHQKMEEISNGDSVYSTKRLKQKLLETYKEHIFFAEREGRKNVICFRDTVSMIINDAWYDDRKKDSRDEARRIVKAAAKILKSEIRDTSYTTEFYPRSDDIAKGKEWLPNLLRMFLEDIIPSEIKQASVGQSIMHAARPRSSLPPILFSLGVGLDHAYGSKWLVNHLAKLGFSISYNEVTRYKQSVVKSINTVESEIRPYPEAFTQWIADNIDHNVRTLDGKNSFHGMGIIATSIPGREFLNSQMHSIPRQPLSNDVSSVVQNKGIQIHEYIEPNQRGLSNTSFQPLLTLQWPYTLPNTIQTDLLWHSGWFASDKSDPRPSWNGFMQHVTRGNHPPKSKVYMLPVIDLKPTDENCMFSTLKYIENQARELNIPDACVTFDQPLWLLASEIIDAKNLNIINRLGGFHLLMSFLGSIGNLMDSSGLNELFETCYGPNAVIHMMSGKAVSRAIRGHFLTEAALMTKLLIMLLPQKADSLTEESFERTASPTYGIELGSDEEEETRGLANSAVESKAECLNDSELEELLELYRKLKQNEIEVDDLFQSSALIKLHASLQTLKQELIENSRTAKLWITYMDYVNVVKLFTRAERTSDWNTHLIAVSSMLNLFAATGHFNYAKCGRLYLQRMQKLPETNPWLYEQFSQHGYHTVRRSNRYWAGLSTDLAIEQIMMRSIKSRGGLTRGRGFTETVRLMWILSMHKCGEVFDSLSSFTGLAHMTSEQHVEMGESRIHRDNVDLNKLITWLSIDDPFCQNDSNLRSLSTGLTSTENDGVNCDNVEEIGATIQRKLDDVKYWSVKMKRSDKITTLLNLKKGIKIDQKIVHVDPLTLFSRLIVVLDRSDDKEKAFHHELTPTPTSLFKDGFMRKSNKSALAKALTDHLPEVEKPVVTKHVLDGGALLHRVKWFPNAPYGRIVEQYQTYINTKYGFPCTVIFDGYEDSQSIKDHEHERRQTSTICANINITLAMESHPNKAAFLANEKNKQQFIKMLSNHLRAAGHIVEVSTGDADTDIAATALALARSDHVTVVADDTDVLILLLYHWTSDMVDIHFRSEAKKIKGTMDVKLVDIRSVVSKQNQSILENLLAIHAWSGCDTTSATYGHGKTKILKLAEKNESVRQCLKVIENIDATQNEVTKSGHDLFVAIYGGRKDDSLNHLRFVKYMDIAAECDRKIQPERLPPTERAAAFHSMRVHIQVMIWKNLSPIGLHPCEWGWKVEVNKLMPIKTDMDSAPEEMLKFVRCKCKMNSRQPCSNNSCSCRKHGLKCVTACKNCQGHECTNGFEEENEIEELEDDANLFERLF